MTAALKKRGKRSHPDHEPVKAALCLSPLWDRYLFGSVAAIRPYFLLKVSLFLLAFDMWILRIDPGAKYGYAGFNVAHFAWLDAFQPLPTPSLYVGFVLLSGMLAFLSVLKGPNRLLLLLLTVSYTYTWAMSLFDSFQHHYFLSLLLAAFIFFPSIESRDLYHLQSKYTDLTTHHPVQSKRKRVVSWAYVLLGVNVAIMYAFTALTKISDPEFLSGEVVQRISWEKQILPSLADWLAGFGMPQRFFWQALALGVILLELFLSVVYMLAARQDESGYRWTSHLYGVSFVIALIFHGGNEVLLTLRIGWFSYYMMLLALVYFLPARALWKFGKVLTWPARKVDESLSGRSATLDQRIGRGSAYSATAASLATAALIILLGFAMDLPGAVTVSLLIAGGLIIVTIKALTAVRHDKIIQWTLITGLAAMTMWAAVTQSVARATFYRNYGYFQKNQGNIDAAIEAYEKALIYIPWWRRRPPPPDGIRIPPT